jgi:hypothetical protein
MILNERVLLQMRVLTLEEEIGRFPLPGDSDKDMIIARTKHYYHRNIPVT